MNLVIKDAVRQIIGRVASALWWFIVVKIITPYLWPLRFGDYSTILKYFAIRSALADFGLYVIALKQLGTLKNKTTGSPADKEVLETQYGKFVSTRMVMIALVYTTALVVAYFIPAYTSNQYITRWLPIGMLFSASFMTAGILQIPLQLYWKMEQLSIGLILARAVQVSFLCAVVYWLFAHQDTMNSTNISTTPFLLIVWSVLLSGVAQGVYVWRTGRKYLWLRWVRDWAFTKAMVAKNALYGSAYFLSSFHTLIVLILLGWLYPTTQGFTEVGIWWMGLVLIEILLIVPSALWNSLIHKVSHETTEQKREKYGSLATLVLRIGAVVTLLFTYFGRHLIDFLWWEAFLTSSSMIGSDALLPRFGIIITMSFVKQVHNYLFVSTGLQNKLFVINLVGVVLWISIGSPLLLKYGLRWWLMMQGLLEFFFLLWSIFVARRQGVSLRFWTVSWICILLITTGLLIFVPWTIAHGSVGNLLAWMLQGVVVTSLLTGVSYPFLKKVLKSL